MKEKFDVIFLEEAREFLNRLNKKTRKKIVFNIWKSKGTLDPRLFKKLRDEIWEFRTHYDNKAYRLLSFWDKTDKRRTLVVGTHAFVKKTDKVPAKEINKAIRIMKEYFNQKTKST